eukprot:4880262-Pyramimonas_sp.AAC.1
MTSWVGDIIERMSQSDSTLMQTMLAIYDASLYECQPPGHLGTAHESQSEHVFSSANLRVP